MGYRVGPAHTPFTCATPSNHLLVGSAVWLQHHCLVWSIQVMFIITPTKLLYRGPHSVTVSTNLVKDRMLGFGLPFLFLILLNGYFAMTEKVTTNQK
ncbi:hypothetical protein VNO80_22223 [Phaseolus coccineus]|uniref:Uncharacterized protein n=1 Tax=Phaseolus coccineus TaxID=3886 RepID=A0AAN9M3Q9_PHACN